MSDDILGRLRNWDASDNSHSSAESMMEMAADEIEQLRGTGIANEPVAWLVTGDKCCEYQYVTLLRESADAAASEEGGTVVPLYRSPTLTSAEREAVEIAVEYVGSAFQVEHYAAVLRGLLDRLK